MSTNLEQIAQEALRLAPAERAELADVLVESLELTSSDELQRLWTSEANRRLTEIRSGKVDPIPGDEILTEARRLAKR